MNGYFPLTLYFASIAFAMWVSRRRGIRALSPFWVFLAFQSLYSLTPWILERIDFTPPIFRLLADRTLIALQLVYAAVANVCFSAVFLFGWKHVPFHRKGGQFSPLQRRFLFWTLPLFLLTCVMAHFYGWHQYTAAGADLASTETLGGMYTVTAYLKFAFVGAYLYYIYRFGLNKGAWILLGEHVIVLFVDGARATFLPVVLLTLFVFLDGLHNPKVLRRVYILAAAGIAMSIGARSLVIADGSSWMKLVTPVAVEGGMGDYPSLQSLAGMERAPHPAYTLGGSYLVDPIVWLIPKGIGRGSLLTFEEWTQSIRPALDDIFAPMGGFYYLSETFAAFGWAGPALITTLFAICLVWMERNKNRYPMLYLSWMPTVGLMFVKTLFGNSVKLFLIQFLCIWGLSLLRRLKLFLFESSSAAAPGPELSST